METDRVVLVDADGQPTGSSDKLAAHRSPGLPHLAFSLVLYGANGKILVQRRAATKYHFASRWSNSCCSHPRPGEPIQLAAARRAWEELGLRVTDLRMLDGFWYRAVDRASGLVEHEFDVVVVGRALGEPRAAPAEVSELIWMAPDDARRLGRDRPQEVTPWLSPVLRRAMATLSTIPHWRSSPPTPPRRSTPPTTPAPPPSAR